MADNTYYIIVEDETFEDFEILREAEKPNVPTSQLKLRIRGPYFIVGENTANGRKYVPEVAHEQYLSYVNNRVSKRNAYGELDHPENIDVNLDRACHLTTKLDEVDNHWIGESTILTGTACGDIVNSLINHGAKFGLSSRSAGKFNHDKTIVENFVLSCFDVVAHPSIGKYVDGILESKQYMLNEHGVIVEKTYTNLEKSLERLPKYDKNTRNKILTECAKTFLKNLRGGKILKEATEYSSTDPNIQAIRYLIRRGELKDLQMAKKLLAEITNDKTRNRFLAEIKNKIKT